MNITCTEMQKFMKKLYIDRGNEWSYLSVIYAGNDVLPEYTIAKYDIKYSNSYSDDYSYWAFAKVYNNSQGKLIKIIITDSREGTIKVSNNEFKAILMEIKLGKNTKEGVRHR